MARGDLGVEVPMETLALIQKEIVKKCNAAGKPVIVATQVDTILDANKYFITQYNLTCLYCRC